MIQYDPTLGSDFASVITVKSESDGTRVDPTLNLLKFRIKTEGSEPEDEFLAVYNPFYGVEGNILSDIESVNTSLVDYTDTEGTTTQEVLVMIPANQFKRGGYVFVSTEILAVNANFPDGIFNTKSKFIQQNRRYYE